MGALRVHSGAGQVGKDGQEFSHDHIKTALELALADRKVDKKDMEARPLIHCPWPGWRGRCPAFLSSVALTPPG